MFFLQLLFLLINLDLFSKPLTLMEKVITLKRFEDEIELKRRQLRNLRMDASSIEAVKQLKGKLEYPLFYFGL